MTQGRSGPRFKISREIITRNAWQKVISLVLAAGLWFVVARQDVLEVEFSYVPVTFGSVPDDMEIISRSATSVAVRVRGLRSQLSSVDPSKMRARSDDFPEDLTDGEVVLNVRPENIATPPGVEVLSVNPQRIVVELEHRLTKRLPVLPTFRKRPPMGYDFVGFTLDPDMITIEAARSKLEGLESVTTEPIELNGFAKSFIERVAIGMNIPNIRVRGLDRIRVEIAIESRSIDRILRSPIRLEPSTLTADLKPMVADIWLRGPELALRDLTGESISVVAVLDDPVAGRNSAQLVVTDLPTGAQLLYVIPEQIEVVIADLTPTPVPIMESIDRDGSSPVEDAGDPGGTDLDDDGG